MPSRDRALLRSGKTSLHLSPLRECTHETTTALAPTVLDEITGTRGRFSQSSCCLPGASFEVFVPPPQNNLIFKEIPRFARRALVVLDLELAA